MPANPVTVLLGMLVTLVAALVGLRLLVSNWSQQAVVLRRATPEVKERRSEWFHSRLDARVRQNPLGRKLWLRLSSAGVALRTVDFVVLLALAAIFGFIAFNAILPPWLAIAGAALAVQGCFAWLDRRREKRRDDFIAQLPDVARLLSNASSAGLAMRRAIEMAADEVDDPARSEMEAISHELRLGQSLEAALANLEQRMPSREVGVLISTLVIQQRSGGDLVRALQELAATLDARRDLLREIRTVMSGSVFTGYLVALVGVAMLFVLNLAYPGVIEEMASSGPGLVALLLASTLWVAGFLLIRRTTRIEI